MDVDVGHAYAPTLDLAASTSQLGVTYIDLLTICAYWLAGGNVYSCNYLGPPLILMHFLTCDLYTATGI